MSIKGPLLFGLGLLALTLSAADRVFARGGQTSHPIQYDLVDVGTAFSFDPAVEPVKAKSTDVRFQSWAALQKAYADEGAKGMRLVGVFPHAIYDRERIARSELMKGGETVTQVIPGPLKERTTNVAVFASP